MFLIKCRSVYQGIAGDVTKLAMKTGNVEKMFSLEVSFFLRQGILGSDFTTLNLLLMKTL